MGPEPAQPFIEDVLAAADPARAERDRKTHTSTRPHWGITMPQLDHAVKRHDMARKEASRRLDAESTRRLLDFLARTDQTGGAP